MDSLGGISCYKNKKIPLALDMEILKSLFYIIIVFFSYNVRSLSQTQNISVYLNKNIISINKDDTILKNNLSKYNFFITGEFHGRKVNNDVFLKLLSVLYYAQNVRVILIESGYAYGVLTNYYLETSCIKTLEILSHGNVDEKDFFIMLKMFYDSLPKNEKIKFIGIDYEREYSAILMSLSMLIPDSNVPDEIISEIVTELKHFDEYIPKYLLDAVIASYNLHKNKFATLLGNNYEEFEKIIIKTIESKEIQGVHYERSYDIEKALIRENLLYNNVLDAIADNPSASFLARGGLAHIGLKKMLNKPNQPEQESFISKLNANSLLKTKICSIAIYNKDKVERKYYKKILGKEENKQIWKTCNSDSLYLIKLDNTESPFQKIALENFQNILVVPKK
jgi:hypothetical protein